MVLFPITHLTPNERQIIKEVLDSLTIKYQARRWDSSRSANPA